MPRMRHPNVAGPYDAHEDQVSHLRMTGWLTDDEWTRAGLPEPPEPEPEDDEPQDDKPNGEPDASGEPTSKKPRARSRATSEEESD